MVGGDGGEHRQLWIGALLEHTNSSRLFKGGLSGHAPVVNEDEERAKKSKNPPHGIGAMVGGEPLVHSQGGREAGESWKF